MQQITDMSPKQRRKYGLWAVLFTIFFLIGILGFFSYYLTDESQLAQFLWNLILLCFILGALVKNQKLDSRKFWDNVFYQSGAMFILSGLLILFSSGWLYFASYGTSNGVIQTVFQIIGILILGVGVLILAMALSFLLLANSGLIM